ncbi:uncharacterized protein [Ptychodera flava]|uniref:uncharacterized protein isoform X1 n=1 Tax=Ptychodera flava TaxID=63121 RepID=UPI003969BF76
MTASTVFNHPTIVTAPHCATKSHEPSILQSMKLKLPSETLQSKAQVPLFAEAKDGNFYQTLCKGGRFHGMCFQSVQVLEKYQQMYEDHATPLRQKNSKIDLLRQQYLQEHTDSTVKDAPNVTSRSLPKWLLPRNQREPKPPDSKGVTTPTKDAGKRDSSSVYGYGSKQSPKKKLCRSLSRSSTVYCMNELELVDTAKMVLKELGCRHSDLMDVIKKKESHISEGNIKNEPEIDRSPLHSHTASETSDICESDQHHQSKDVFPFSRNDHTESERKDIASDGSPSQQTGRHTVRQTGKHQDSCEMNSFPANKTFPDSESDPLRISQQDTTNTPVKKKINQGPDLTFLDDIF